MQENWQIYERAKCDKDTLWQDSFHSELTTFIYMAERSLCKFANLLYRDLSHYAIFKYGFKSKHDVLKLLNEN